MHAHTCENIARIIHFYMINTHMAYEQMRAHKFVLEVKTSINTKSNSFISIEFKFKDLLDNLIFM
jgi:hypothetical protein